MGSGCAAGKARKAERPPEPVDTCTAIVEENRVIPDSILPEKTIKFRRMGAAKEYNRCYTPKGLRHFARKAACEEGYAFAHLYNIQSPGYWDGPCAMGDADLYRVVPSNAPSPGPVRRFETVPNSGLQLFATAAAGGAFAGNQKNTGLTPRPPVDKVSLGISAEYYRERLGLEADFDYLGRGIASRKDYKSVSLYNSMVFRTGVAGTLWRKARLLYTLKLDGSAGANYTLLKINQEYVDLLEEGVIQGWGGGFGYYGKIKLKFLLTSGLTGYAGAKYEFENPTLDGASEPLDAHTWQAILGAGYRF
jgi:hypothetical protein